MTVNVRDNWGRGPEGLTRHWSLNGGSPYAIGLDLGQATDFSALAIVEHVNVLPPGYTEAQFRRDIEREERQALMYGGLSYGSALPAAVRELHVVHLQRWELGTPYHSIVNDLGELTSREGLGGARLMFDNSGVGRGVREMLWRAYCDGRMPAYPRPVTITGEGGDGTSTRAKRNLMAALQLPIQQGRFRIPRGLPLANVLERELTSFKMRLTRSGHDTYNVSRREGEGHGDLVIACALACDQPEFSISPTPRFTPAEEAGR